MRAARELGEAHGGNGAWLHRDEREREQSEASGSEWERVVGAQPSCSRADSAVVGVWPPCGGHGLVWSATDAARVRDHQSPAFTSDRATL